MKKRIITATVLIAVLVPLILIDHVATKVIFAVIAMFLSGVGSFEIINAMYKESNELKIYRYIMPVLSSILCGLCLFATYKSSLDVEAFKNGFVYHFYVLIFFLLSVVLVFGLMIFTPSSQARAMMGCLLSLVYPGLMLGYVLSMRYFAPVELNNNLIHLNGVKSFAYIYIIVIMTDTFAYFVGSKLGKTKLCPNISPNKSVAGAVGGGIAGAISGLIVAYALKIVNPSGLKEILLTSALVLLISAFLSVVVQIGDLVESKLKRSFGVKDFGNIFPGHGGVLDRFDSLIYSGIWFYVIVQIIQIILIGA